MDRMTDKYKNITFADGKKESIPLGCVPSSFCDSGVADSPSTSFAGGKREMCTRCVSAAGKLQVCLSVTFLKSMSVITTIVRDKEINWFRHSHVATI